MAENMELKNNLKSFREAFRDYTDYYTVIGGTACMILMEEAGRVRHRYDFNYGGWRRGIRKSFLGLYH